MVDGSLDRETAEEYAEWFRTLSDATRVQLLAWLARQPAPVPVKDIVEAFPYSQSTVSHHLAALTTTCFLTVERRGTSSFYAVNPACLQALPDATQAIMNGRSTPWCCPPAAAGGDAGVTEPDALREAVQARYAVAARTLGQPGCCGSLPDADRGGAFGATLYLPVEVSGAESAVAASLGCGVPTEVAELQPGETVLDLGSGAGADVVISARRVGPTGRAIGLDMTPEMLGVSRANAEAAGLNNVEFHLGYLESIPLPDDSVDVIISNCVINLAADKDVVLREAARVLRPGGRLAMSDVVAERELADQERRDLDRDTGCIAGALTEAQYVESLAAAGFVAVEVTLTHRVHEVASAAIIRAAIPQR